MKLLKERCHECSICAMFFSSSLAVSINALFLSRILSAILIREFLILFLTLVTSCMPFRKRFSNRAWPIYTLSAHSFPLMFFRNLPASRVPGHPHFQVWTWNWGFHPCHWLSDVAWIRKTIPWNIFLALRALQMSYESESFGYDRHVKELSPQNWYRYRFPAGLSLWKWSGEATPPSPVPQNGYRTPSAETGVPNVCRHTLYNNAWSSGNHRSGTE